jgi:predicted metal-dependent peptidase
VAEEGRRSDAHGHRGTRAIQRMVEYAPSTGGLALWVAHRDLPDDEGAAPKPARRDPVIATDGHTVYYDAAFSALPLAAQTGLVAHEVLHIALRHPQRLADLQQRLGDVDAQLYNICADAIVNSALGHLAWLSLPAAAVRLEQLLNTALGGQHSAEAALLSWDVERLYRAIDDRQPAGRSGQRDSRATQAGGQGDARDVPQRADGARSAVVRALGAQGIADLLPSPRSQGAQGDPEAQADQARMWSERILRAHAGDGAHSMLRALVADLPRTRTPWEQVLRAQLARCLSQRLDVSWSRPSRSYLANQGRCGPHRRMPFEPGFTPRRAAPRLVVVVDVSGSIEAALLERFTREIEAITRRLEAGVTVVIGDQRVQRVERFEPGRCALRDLHFQGGGGTDFTPLLEEADRHDPDLTVVLTDLQGPARFRPRAPVLWAVPEAQAAAVQPFGRKLTLR